MFIETERLILRDFLLDDINDVYEFMSDPEVSKYELSPAMSWDQTVAYLNKHSPDGTPDDERWIELAIELKAEKRVIGGLSIRYLDRRFDQAEIGFRIHRDFQRQGYGTEACRALLLGLFETGTRRVIGATDALNVASWRLMEKIGMRREAHFRKKIRTQGEYHDEFVYAILQEDLKETGNGE